MRAPGVLMVAYHFPPCAGSSGLQRTLSFCRHLSELGWRPVVLTAVPSAYERTSDDQLNDVPSNVLVARVPALDAARHLAIRGRHLSRLAVPDRWWTWQLPALLKGRRLVRDLDLSVIWSTYPIATALNIGATLSRWTGKPWVADFRDPMVEFDEYTAKWYPVHDALRAARVRIEKRVSDQAAEATFSTHLAKDIFSSRYPDFPRERMTVLPNGFDEQAFVDAEKIVTENRQPRSAKLVLLHSGTIYPGPDRDPSVLFAVLRELNARGSISPHQFELRLRATDHDEYFRDLAYRSGVSDLVRVVPHIGYRQALAEMMSVDGLLLLQGAPSNTAVPAKLYEYFRAGRPIVSFVHPKGETARVLREAGLPDVAALDDVIAVRELFTQWLSQARSRSSRPNNETVGRYSRRVQAQELANLLQRATRSPSRTA